MNRWSHAAAHNAARAAADAAERNRRARLAAADMQVRLDRIRALCHATSLDLGGRTVVLAGDVLAVLDDPRPLG